jgi:2-oxoglutarate dehydrogenase E1 component
MSHRGRLNVLANVLRKPLYKIFQEFQGEQKGPEEEWGKSGDVKYHLGTSYKRTYDDTGKTVEIHLLPNPSHLEFVNPVVCGFVRANQHFERDQQRYKNIGILIHGDAAFAGQGIVYETIQMADLYNYTTGGVIHIVVNNQIGFTTTPLEARSSLYCTDLAKTIGAPIFHVNADDILAVEKCCKLAAEYRMKFKKDVIVDIIGYRKYGHNELDQPSFTQPLMYERVKTRRNVLDIYEDQLINAGILTKQEAKEEYRDRIWQFMTEKYNKARKLEADKAEWIPSEWDTIKTPKNFTEFRNTGVEINRLKAIGKQICTIPKDFDAHKMIRKIYENRLQSIEEGKGIDWGTAEALAFATLIDEDFHVRISGEDVERGTFSHRHAILHSQSQDEEYIPLEKFHQGRIRKFIASNSHLSENAVLGFEYGYSIVNPNNLTIWEAQFGDFYNGAQVIVDQFIASGETKWEVSSGLVLLLPHGYDGAGPEHSSGRLERFLEMCDDDQEHVPTFEEEYFNTNMKTHNWQVVNASTSANYFHLLRRQMHRDFRKPLIVMAPKKLLKLKEAGSNIEEFGAGLRFSRTIGERDNELIKDSNRVKRIIFCSGQIYYDIAKERKSRKDNETAIITIEQLFPLPYDHIKRHLERFPNANDIVWCQEEPKNYGAYAFIKPRMYTLFRKLGIEGTKTFRYSGRAPNASPATGYSKVHIRQQQDLINEAFGTNQA